MYDIVMPWKSLWQKKGFWTKPKFNYIAKNSAFSKPPSTDNILSETMYIIRIYVETDYVLSMY